MSNRQITLFALAAIQFCHAGVAAAISPEELRIVLSEPGASAVVVIDIRDSAAFRRGHIPGSLHIASFGVERRNVPPFGRAAVIWDGIDEEAAETTLRALNAKPGIEAELLDGGFPAWTAGGGSTGGAPGLELAVEPSVTYDQLLKLAGDPDLVLVDLRKAEDDTLTDLDLLLPNVQIIAPRTFERREMKRSLHTDEGLDHQGVRKRGSPNWLRDESFDESSLYILIDGGDGRMSERVARRMATRGLKRVYVLLGGEKVLQADGKPASVTVTRSIEISP